MNVLVIGSGGREHAFGWKISKSKIPNKLFFAPGNAGTERIGINLDVDISNFNLLKNTIVRNNINLVLVGPEVPLVSGISDFIHSNKKLEKINVIGPKKLGAMLEGSKSFAKEFMERHNIPTAPYKKFSLKNLNDGLDYLESISPPYVLKANGLAAGKGVLIINELEKAKNSLVEMLKNKKFGSASKEVVIEGFLDGIELSCFVLTDGDSFITLPYAKDYKRIGEGDSGLNTGGMGAISPVPFNDKDFKNKIENKIIKPTIKGLKKDNIDYLGFIFIGLINVKGEPFVIEYNVRMGDPETQVVLPRIKNDFLEILLATANNKLSEIKLDVSPNYAVTIVSVSGGYPESYEKGLDVLGDIDQELVFQAGTLKKNNKIVTNGGRVFSSTALGSSIKIALSKAYKNLKKIKFKGMYFRKDIGFDL
ncbi:MAG: phosphoribosylamine--glycine ligase [Bacteroidota bacterium]|nr:phosphoribosylamine--glycine ligase [Bacteroidota bacterium]MEC7246990.1 phosphoribosylamine--glycine ligase [Bacteroidota bacterium]MEC7286825.1 phosphoribosylamine--glycine ligase [Bacteroidota bacterium]MEC8363731.1 phosphoribosylamine--glycine ligase [Bacteroidota bacterium]MEC9161048.1 phosphoribosylamine--glycine ligase [Bacteroidota bacterium]